MGRRWDSGRTISLFAFQDVMAAVIGILFFVVLLMALDILNQTRSGTATDSGGSLARLQERRRELQTEASRLQTKLDRWSERLALASGFDEAGLRRQVAKLHDRALKTHQTLSKRLKELQEIETKRKHTEARLSELSSELRKQYAVLGELGRQLESHRETTGPRVVWLQDAPSDKEPWLIEITGDVLRVGAKDGRMTAEFQAESGQQRIRQFLEWAESRDADTEYFVCLLKPSGTRWLTKVSEGVADLGFSVGVDLLPEGWNPY
ncbi:MAG: hypothetical protein ACOC8H_00030 [bacterium]